MLSFLLEYGMFTAKLLTLILVILAALTLLMTLIAQRQEQQEYLHIEKLNDRLEELRDSIESELLTKEDYKSLKKERKKQEKADQQNRKKRLKNADQFSDNPRLFVLRFVGDMHASEVESLRQCVTGILSVANPQTDKVMMIIESAGGYVHHYGLAASQLQRIREQHIPLIASIDLVAASGGYLMASVANTIQAAPFAIVGSIGVLAQVPNFHRLLKKYDIDVEQHSAGEYKTTLTLFGENTNKARDKFKQELQETHELFKQFICEHRQLDINQLATGEHWYGTQALKLNLIDRIITSDDFLVEESKQADIYEISYEVPKTLLDKVHGFIQGSLTRLFSRL